MPNGRACTARETALIPAERQSSATTALPHPGGGSVRGPVREPPPTNHSGYMDGYVTAWRISQAITTAPEAPSSRNVVTEAPRPGRVGGCSWKSRGGLRPAPAVTISAIPAASATKAQIRARVRSSSGNRVSIPSAPMFQSPGSRSARVVTPVATRAAAATEDRSAATAATTYTTSIATSIADVAGLTFGRAST